MEEFVTPEKWCIKADKGIAAEFFDKQRYYKSDTYVSFAEGYLHRFNLNDEDILKNGRGASYHGYLVREGYTEITLEQFKKHILKETEDLLKIARKKYPVGTRFINASEGDKGTYIVKGALAWFNHNYYKDKEAICNQDGDGLVYCKGNWAEIVPQEKKYEEMTPIERVEFMKLKYPVGTKFREINGSNIFEVETYDKVLLNSWACSYHFLVNCVGHIGIGKFLYYNNKWAEIVSEIQVEESKSEAEEFSKNEFPLKSTSIKSVAEEDLIGRYVEVLIDCPQGTTLKIGDIIQIDSKQKYSYKTKCERNVSLTPDRYKILPKDYQPITFKKGDYYVVTEEYYGYNGKLNLCYKVLRDSYTDSFYFQELSSISTDKVKVRKATKEEGWMYEKEDKPCDVTIKNESEQGYFDLSNHIGRYLEALIDAPFGGVIKKGEIGKIINGGYANFPSQNDYSCYNALMEKNSHLFRLMPIDFNPENTSDSTSMSYKWEAMDVKITRNEGASFNEQMIMRINPIHIHKGFPLESEVQVDTLKPEKIKLQLIQVKTI